MAIPKILDLARRAINDEGGWLNDEVWLGPKRSSARGDYYDDAYLSPTALYLAPTSRVGVQKIVKLDNANGLVLMDYDYTNDTGFYSYQDILDSDGLRLYQTSDRYAYVTNTGSFGYNADTVYSGKLDFKGNNLEFNSQHLDGGYGLLDIDSGYLQLDQYSSGNSSRGYYTYLGNNQLFIRQYNSDGSMTNGTLEYDGVSGALDVQYYSNGKLNGSTIKLRGKDTDPYIKLTPYSNGVAKVNGGYLYLGGDQITSRYYEDSVSYWNFDINSYGIQFYQQYETGVYEEYYNQLYEDTLELSYYDGGSRSGGRIYGYRNSTLPYINLYYYNNGTATYGYGQYKSNYLRMKKLYSTTDGSAHYGDLIIQNNSSSPYVQWKYYNAGSLNGYSFESYPINSGSSYPYTYLNKYSSGSLVGRIEILHGIDSTAKGGAWLQFTDYYGDYFYLDFHEDSYLPESLVNKRYVDALVANIKTTEIYCGGEYDDYEISLNSSGAYTFDYTGGYQSITLPPGTYKLECWGAQGGYRSSSTYGGKGGYSTGIITIPSSTTLYIYVGGAGGSSTTDTGAAVTGGFNGGGYRYGYPGGGGGTDIRIGSTSLYARVIVAGGGGSCGSTSRSGKYGGGEAGGSSTESFSYNSTYCGKGGTQTYSGVSTSTTASSQNTSYLSGYTDLSYIYGGFGFGGAGIYKDNGYGGAGGGGWYGGSGTIPDGSGDDDRGGGGGSGYVYTEATAASYPTGCLLNSSYYLAEAKTVAGSQTFLSPTGASETGHSGNGYVKITPCSYDFSYTGSYSSVTLAAGSYKLECWGAQGGSASSVDAYSGGKGGYSSGILTLDKSTTLYIYVGGQGSYYTTSTYTSTGGGGYNGGGNAGYYGGGGGGGTDIRIGSTSLYARAIVAGGGGGSYYYNTSYRANGGAGGGTSGKRGNQYSTSYADYSGGGGTQTAGGLAGIANSSSYYGTAGSFGQGGSTGYKYNSTSYYSAGGGGGGWYGGGGAGNYSSSSRYYAAGGGGGSGYVYTISTAKNYPSGCLLNSSYYLTGAELVDGTETIISPTGAVETGHSGNGYVRITGIAPAIYPVLIAGMTEGNYYTPYVNSDVYVQGDVLFGAAWNDYAEFRKSDWTVPGQVVIESPDGQMKLSHERLLPGAEIVSDTYGFAIGKTATYSTPIAVSGRVLAYPNEDRYSYPLGAAVCSGPNGTVSLMTREEIREYPERIIGTVSEIPEYEVWGERQVKVNGRIWIRVR